MHVQCLSITPASADRRGHNDQLVLCDKVPNTSLFACRLVARVGLDVEFKGCNEGQKEGKKELECEEHVDGRRQGGGRILFRKGGAGGMRLEAHDCLGHAAVGGVVEGVVALFGSRSAAYCTLRFRHSHHIFTHVFISCILHNPKVIFNSYSRQTRCMRMISLDLLSRPQSLLINIIDDVMINGTPSSSPLD